MSAGNAATQAGEHLLTHPRQGVEKRFSEAAAGTLRDHVNVT